MTTDGGRQDRREQIKPFDVAAATADDIARLYDLMWRCHVDSGAGEPYRTLADMEAFLRYPPSFEPRRYWVAAEDGGCAGFGQFGSAVGSTTGRVEILVGPEARLRGLGRALLDAVAGHASLLGCRELIGAHTTAAGAAFAARVGAADTLREVRLLLRLPARAPARAPVGGYSLISWVGAAPEEVVASFALAREAVNDAPRASEQERFAWSVDRVRELEIAVAQRDREVRVTAACDDAGAVVAFSELRVSNAAGAVASTEDTAVLPAHRRRGLASWVKAESLRRLQQDRPDVLLVATTNAEDNSAMLGVNRALGFRPAEIRTRCVLEIA